MMKNDSPVSIDVFEVDEDPEDELDKPGTTTGTKFSVLQLYPNPVFNEMWFLTVDPFVGISVFIAKLSKRQNCRRVFEDIHSQEKSNSLTYTAVAPCVCTSPLAVMTVVGLHDFAKVSIFCIIQVLFADRMHRRARVDNFPKVRIMLLFHAPLILIHFWPASTLLRKHLALATL